MSDEAVPSIEFSAEVREWAVRVVAAEQAELGRSDAIDSVAQKVGCTAQTLRGWLHEVDRAGGFRRGMFGPTAAAEPGRPRPMITLLHESIGPGR